MNEPDPAPEPMFRANPNLVRDHLANERTYLAWLRSGLALLGLGFVVARLRVELGGMAPAPVSSAWLRGATIGLGFAALGLFTLIFATWRYYSVRRMIETGEFTPLGAGVMVLSVGSLAVAVIVILSLLERLGLAH